MSFLKNFFFSSNLKLNFNIKNKTKLLNLHFFKSKVFLKSNFFDVSDSFFLENFIFFRKFYKKSNNFLKYLFFLNKNILFKFFFFKKNYNFFLKKNNFKKYQNTLVIKSELTYYFLDIAAPLTGNFGLSCIDGPILRIFFYLDF